MSYLEDGGRVARAVFLHQLSPYYGMRSFFYSMGILPLHQNTWAWPVIALQCGLVAFVLWLMVRTLLPKRPIAAYLMVMALLSMFTSVSWYASLILPDVLGPLVYLSLALLVFARDALSRAERFALAAIACWGITAHATHFVLAAGLSVFLCAVLLVERRPWREVLSLTGGVGLILLLAAVAQMALYGSLYHKLTLNGERPPFLMARVIGDGPGRWYLENNCAHLNWIVCKSVGNLPENSDVFLWSEGGVWQSCSDRECDTLVREEMPLVLGTLRAYPGEQFARSMGNAWDQLSQFGVRDLDAVDWLAAEMGRAIPTEKSSYEASRQRRNGLSLKFFTDLQFWVVVIALGLIAGCALLLRGRMPMRLVELSVSMIAMVLANALVTGVMSMPDDRYEARVIWMIPFIAALCVLTCFNARRAVYEEVSSWAGEFGRASWIDLKAIRSSAGSARNNQEAFGASSGLTRSRSSLDGLKYGTRLAGTSTRSPVFGFRPMREFRWRMRNEPKPRISILSPLCRALMTDPKMVSTITSPSRRVRSPKPVTFSTRSAFVISFRPPLTA